ncbi:MAG: hypothetical protein AVDCRST_MAG60-1424 [uncultured Nocardioides sp.]|uniref:Uncharacterized protein n=1 Tax=uncultured Nocardioides sp. TaxID=198441 RepID=A0A6J4NIM6_9ACTN|nr:MAG: hypothetical protein AVDCRST_MAG60-1424 [uncultured Nocardioides sp.]
MREHPMATGLVCSWRMVTDRSGRAHMEACWTPAESAPAVASPTAA